MVIPPYKLTNYAYWESIQPWFVVYLRAEFNMKVVALLLIFLVGQGSTLSIFCYEGQAVTGRFVYFEYPTLDGAQGCCTGGAGSVLVYNSANGNYFWYNCPASSVRLPLECHVGSTCSNLGTLTSTTGASAVDECCMSGIYNSFNVPNHDVCFTCIAPISPPVMAQNAPQNAWNGATKNRAAIVSVLMGCLLSLLAR